MKGYYYEDRELVSKIKTKVVGAIPEGTFKTIECSMMDVADDIAYSTYGLEDNFKAGFLQPLDLFDVSDEIAVNVAATTQKRIREAFPELPVSEQTFSTDCYLYCSIFLKTRF